MGDVTPFRRMDRGPRGPHGRRGRKGDGGLLYPLIVGGFALLVFYLVLNTDKMPAAVQGIVSASRDLGRENSPPAGAFYPNCDAARAAGVAPLYAGEPGYREGMDGDGDGVACEVYRGR